MRQIIQARWVPLIAACLLAALLLLADLVGLGRSRGIGGRQMILAAGLVLVGAMVSLAVPSLRRSAARIPRREIRIGIGLSLVSLILSLALAEAGLRIIRPASVGLDHQPLLYNPDESLGFVLTPNGRDYIERREFRIPITLNNLGFHDDDFNVERPAGTELRIVALGDSFTNGFEVGRGYTYPDVLEQQLRAQGCGCEVMNFAQSASGTVQQMGVYERYASRYEPDIVLVGFFENDVNDVALGRLHRETYGSYMIGYQTQDQRRAAMEEVDWRLRGGGGTLRFAIERSYLLRALYNTVLSRHWPGLQTNIVNARGIEIVMPLEEAYGIILDQAVALDETCEAAGCTVIFVIIPSRFRGEFTAGEYSADLTADLAVRGIRVITPHEVFHEHEARGEVLSWKHDTHMNAAGNTLLAEQIALYLEQEGLLPH